MNWFKHKTQSHSDEKLAEYLSDCGLEGYGFWWLLMEVVASQCVGDKCDVSYTLSQWSRSLYCHHNRVGKYLGKLEVIGIVSVEYSGGKVRVTIPNLLKYRDEYSRKSGQNQDSIRSKNKKKNIEENKDKNLSASGDAVDKNESDFFLTKKGKKLSGKRLETFNLFWEAFNHKKGKAEAADAWLNIPTLTEAVVGQIVKAASSEASNRSAMIAEGRTPKMAQGWIAGRRWEDEHTSKPESKHEYQHNIMSVSTQESEAIRRTLEAYNAA